MANPIERAPGVWGIQFKVRGERFSGTFKSSEEAANWQESTKRRLHRRFKSDRGLTSYVGLPPRVADAIASCEYSEYEIVKASNPIADLSGIYFLVSEGRVVYVGQSSNVLHRIARHKRDGREFDSFTYLLCDPEDRDRIEKKYIEAIMPWMNMSLGRN